MSDTITVPRVVLEQALEALGEATHYTSCESWSPSMTDDCLSVVAKLRAALEQPQVEQEPALWIRRETLEQVQRVPPNKEEPENGVAGGQRLLMNVVLSAIPHSYYGQVPLYTKLDSEHNHA